jgi:glycosyltransferase involved in cell wall biosynthesis
MLAKKRKVAFVFNHPYFLGGGEISLYQLICKLNKDKFELVVIVPAEGEIKDRLKSIGVEIRSINLPTLKSVNGLKPLYMLLKLVRILRREAVQIVHANGPRACLYAGLAGRCLGIPTIWHVRESLCDYTYYDLLLARIATKIICVSNSVKNKRFGKFSGSVNDKIAVVYNGVDISRFKKNKAARAKIRKRLGVGPDELLVGLIGNVIPRKSQDLFIKGLHIAKHRQQNLPVKVVIVGRYLDSKYAVYLQRLTADLGLEANVIFNDYQQRIVDMFSALDIFALTSKSEGFCRALIEAMSCGLPVIASKIAEIQEAVTDEENGILVEYGNQKAVTEALMRLYLNRETLKEMGKNNRYKAWQAFSLDRHVGKMESIYESI